MNKDSLITVVLYQAQVSPGATIDFSGEWIEHPSYGLQFKATKSVEQKPADVASLERYLGSGLIKGVGPSTAKKIVRKFGIDTLQVFEEEIDRLKEIKGLTGKKLKSIKESWLAHRSIKDLMLFLQHHEVSTLLATKIYKTYGDRAMKVLKENPYQLARDITGVGFFTADSLAKKLGLSPQDPTRYRAGINFVLYSAKEEGHCYLYELQIKSALTTLLFAHNKDEFQLKTFEDALFSMQQEKQFVTKNWNGQKCFFSIFLDRDEETVSQKIKIFTATSHPVDENRIDTWIKQYLLTEKIQLSREQLLAVKGIVQNKASILTGGPGCGKTTTTKAIVKLILAMKKHVQLAAPTGRAAQRMSEVIGLSAQTLHRLLGYDPSSAGFKHREDYPLPGDFFIFDECSMLDISLTAAILKAIPQHAQILFIGDPDQLPAVGPGNVLKDLINCKLLQVFQLTQVFRQGKESSIITSAHDINKGIYPQIPSPFQDPTVWQNKIQTLFIDCEELTSENIKFIHKVKQHLPLWQELCQNELELKKNAMDEIFNKEDVFKERLILPEKWQHVSIENLLNSATDAQEIKAVFKKIHPYSCIHYNLTSHQMILKLLKDSIPKYWGNQLEVQILTPMHKGTLGTAQLNQLLQENANSKFNAKTCLTVGNKRFALFDRVIHKKNNYNLDVFNGDIGIIVELDLEEQKLIVKYEAGKFSREVVYEKEDLLELDLAYAITIHKSQGSEFDAVIIPLATQHFTLLNRNLIYTGLTRAKKLAIFIGSRRALQIALNNTKQEERQTLLTQRLLELI